MDISEYKDQDTDTSLTESESESEDLAASLALDECCLEPIRPSIDITVNEDEEDLPQKPGIFRLRGGYEDPLKNDPFVVKFPGMAGCPCTSCYNRTACTIRLDLRRLVTRLYLDGLILGAL